MFVYATGSDTNASKISMWRSVDCMNNMLKTLVSNEGVKCILVAEYKYQLQQNLRDGDILWCCTVKFCTATVRTNETGMVITWNFNGDHGHDGLSQRDVNASVILTACKRKAKDAPYEKLMKIMPTSLGGWWKCQYSRWRRWYWKSLTSNVLHTTDLHA